jgi:superfamily II DNA or RNA helicase
MIIFNDAQTENLGFLENHKDEQELAIQMPTGSGKTYIIKYLSLNGEFENITIIVMSRLVVVRQTYCQYYKNNGSLQIVFYCSEDDRDDDSNGDDDDFEMPKLDTTSRNKRKIILTPDINDQIEFPKKI